MKRKILLVTIGSLGDLYPFLALAKALRDLGLQPVLASAAMYRERVEAEGIGFLPIRPDEPDIVARLGMTMPELVTRLTRDDGFLLSAVLIPFLRANYADVFDAVARADLVVAHPLSVAAKLAAEKLGVPQVNFVLSPALFLSAYDPPRIGPIRLISQAKSLPAVTFNRTALKLCKVGTSVYARQIHRFRREIGLAKTSATPFLEDGTAIATIGMFSPLLAGLQPDYPVNTSIVGSSFYDRDTLADGISPDLQRFMDAGPAPLVFTLGSFAVLEGESFFRASIEAARRLGSRAVLLTTEADRARLSAELPDGIVAAAYVPHSQLFPRAAAIVHHGGIGTTAQALRAGKPQLIVPFFGDQHDNAGRLCRLGVARKIERKRYTAARAEAELRALLESPLTVGRAKEFAPFVARENGAVAAARILDDLLRQQVQPETLSPAPLAAAPSIARPVLEEAAAASPH
jgi:UDP:flavonoid glycosyltransferase YjiC (YdhE family)